MILPIIIFNLASAQSCIQIQSNIKFTEEQINNAKKTYKDGLYFAKRGKYTALRIGMFNNFVDAKKYLVDNKKLFSNAVIIKDCNNDFNLPILNINDDIQIKKDIFVKSNEQMYEKNNEIEFVKTIYDIKKDDNELFDHYSYSNYFKRLMKEDENLENNYYSNELTKIEQLIREDEYNSDIYLSASSGILNDYTTGTKESTFDSNVRLNWRYRLYDGKKTYIYDQFRKLSEENSEFSYKNAKNSLALLGSDLYGNLFLSQVILKFYEGLHESQKTLYSLIHENRKNGLATIIDEIDSKDDLFELDKQIINYKILHSRNTFILKQSINSKSNKPLFLMPLEISSMEHSEKEEKRLLLKNNPSIVLAQNSLKNSKANILSENSRRLPTVDLSASTGYSWTKDLITLTQDQGTNWEAQINLRMPIYERNDIFLNEQKNKVIALQDKNNLKLAIKEALNSWEIHKKTIQQLQKVNSLLKQQLSGQTEKLNIVKKLYLEGKADYRDYADALNRFTVINIDYITNVVNSEKQKLIGNYLLGKKVYNAEN